MARQRVEEKVLGEAVLAEEGEAKALGAEQRVSSLSSALRVG